MLKDLNLLGNKLKKEFETKFSHKDVMLPESFMNEYKTLINNKKLSLGYKSVEFYKYSVEITTSTNKKISLPNYWFIAAYHFSPFISELLKYKDVVRKITNDSTNLSNDWSKTCKDNNIIPFNKNNFEVTRDLHNDEYDYFSNFLLDYSWWWGAKTVDRSDFYVSPVLKLGSFLAESQSAIAEIAWQIAHIENAKFNDDIISILNINSLNFEKKTFNILNFIEAIEGVNLKFQKTIPFRFVSALQTKPFVILTGLSGSGKTKLAEAFTMWITNRFSQNDIFKKGNKIEAARSTYVISDVDRIGVLVDQSGSNSKTFLPFELIKIWVRTIIENNFDDGTGSQEIQDKVLENKIPFSKTLNSFHSPLKALALEYIEIKKLYLNSESETQYCMVSVGADWTNREPLLGFPNALVEGTYVKPDCGALDLIIRAEKDRARPYFLILDEMNMSHVERYFADFLSAMESTDRTITLHPDTKKWEECDVPATIELPENLFIIGTVNIDETTYMFSPKVLDRANVIEFRVSDSEMKSFFEEPKELKMDLLRSKGVSMGESFVSKAKEKGLIAEELGEDLMPFFEKLQEAGAEFGYRTASEISRFVAICTDVAGKAMSEEEIIDAAIMQKLLPKVHGSRNKIEKILKELGKLCLKDSKNESFQLNEDKNDKNPVKYPLSYEKLKRMHKRVISDGFTSFAEA